MRVLSFILLLLVFSLANAQTPPCVPVDPGWTQTYFAPSSIQFVAYNTTTKAMVVTFYTSPPSNRIFQNVPLSIAQGMYGLTNPTAYFNANVASYPEALLTTFQSNMCPILAQTASWILTHPNSAPPQTNYLLSDSKVILDSDSGQKLLKG